jgi:hypothetical protein
MTTVFGLRASGGFDELLPLAERFAGVNRTTDASVPAPWK